MSSAREGAERLREVARAHPRQFVVAAAVAGLLFAPVWRPGVLVAAVVFSALVGRRVLAALLVVAVLGGAVAADARLAALDRSRLGRPAGRGVELDVVLLEQPRTSARAGPAWLGGPSRRALVSIASGGARGERVVVRAPGRVRWPIVATGAILRARGRLGALGRFDSYQRRRGAHAVLRADALAVTGGRRGGVAGALDRVRARVERALQAGLPAPQAALLRGMVLGQDEQLSEPVREDFRRSGLAHLLALYTLAITKASEGER